MTRLFPFLSFLILTLGAASFTSAVEPVSEKFAVRAQDVAPKNIVNINTAGVEELMELKGIGEKKAEAIIAWRKENGNFKSVEDLLEVKGIGDVTLEVNRKNISL